MVTVNILDAFQKSNDLREAPEIPVGLSELPGCQFLQFTGQTPAQGCLFLL
jgi:hypothetical protein